MRKFIAIIIAGLAFGLAPAAQAATQKGQSEIGFQASLIDAASTSVIVGVTYGYFFTDALQLTGTVFVFGDDAGGADYATGLDIGADYHFNTSADWVPYVGAGLGSFSSSSGFTSSTYNIRAGIKGFISENTAMDISVRTEDSSDFLDATTTFGVGMRFFFGGD